MSWQQNAATAADKAHKVLLSLCENKKTPASARVAAARLLIDLSISAAPARCSTALDGDAVLLALEEIRDHLAEEEKLSLSDLVERVAAELR